MGKEPGPWGVYKEKIPEERYT